MHKIGKQTYHIPTNVYISAAYNIAGPLEGCGAFGSYYDMTLENDEWDCKSHEKCEIKMRKEVIDKLLERCNLSESDIDCLIGGDLLNQVIATTFSAREFEIPMMGLYTACSTFGLALAVSAMMISGGFMSRVICSTSSHYGTAERQYRFPLELGTQPSPPSQWTVTGAAACLLTDYEDINCKKPLIESVTLGKIVDLGISDAANMGAAMAPSAWDTILNHLRDTGRQPMYYDMIITGDLGKYGRDLLHYLAKMDGIELGNVLNDCGAMIYSPLQKAMQGGSGAGCSSLVFSSYLYKELIANNLQKILFVPTGALLSKVSSLQGESIPAVSFAISIEI